MPTHAEQVRNHWWWRPGRSFYTWHLTFTGQPDVARVARHYHSILRDLPGVDPVPVEWLHLTMQGLGFSDEVTPDQVDEVVAAVRGQLATLAPFESNPLRPLRAAGDQGHLGGLSPLLWAGE